MNCFIHILATFALSVSVLFAGQSERIKFNYTLTKEQTPAGKGLPTLPWVSPSDTSWYQGAPIFSVFTKDSVYGMRGWLAMSEKNLMLKVIISEKEHYNKSTYYNLWDGDNLQVAVDALGDGSGKSTKDTKILMPDDGEICFALIPSGAMGFEWESGRPEGAQQYDKKYAKITRDEKGKKTIYKITLPWSDFQTIAGESNQIGLRIVAQDKDSLTNVIHQICWGDSAHAQCPGLYPHVSITKPVIPYSRVVPLHSTLWDESDTGKYKIITYGNALTKLKISGELLDTTIQLLDAASQSWNYHILSIAPGKLFKDISFAAALKDSNEKCIRVDSLLLCQNPVQTLHDEIKSLISKNTNPLFIRHLRSIDLLCQTQWLGTLYKMYYENDLENYTTTNDARLISKALKGNAGKWDEYGKGTRYLVFCYTSRYDNSLQYYLCTLPLSFDKNKSYPLVVSLHGAQQNIRPLAFFAKSLSKPEPFIEREEMLPPDRDFIQITPWARGNTSFQGAGEHEVLQSMEDVKKVFKIDEDRQYLCGFSMGGGGTWALAIQNPDMWAAVCIAGGGSWYVPVNQEYGRNVSYLPVRIWHGDSDLLVPLQEAIDMAEELRYYGNDLSLVIVKGLSHSFPIEHRLATSNWLKKFKRKRPDSFFFKSDSYRHSGVWGIDMDYDRSICEKPSFNCTIKGSTVSIDSKGTQRLFVKLGLGGLGLQGNATIIWNGTKVYEGEVKTVELSENLQAK